MILSMRMILEELKLIWRHNKQTSLVTCSASETGSLWDYSGAKAEGSLQHKPLKII
jgi:hypothetical protein